MSKAQKIVKGKKIEKVAEAVKPKVQKKTAKKNDKVVWLPLSPRKNPAAADKAILIASAGMLSPKTKPIKAKAEAPAVVTLNPYREHGGYWSVVEGLRTLGIDKVHPQTEVVAAVRKAMGADWKAFANKPKRNEETALDANGKAWVNVGVVARKNDYGKPLIALGYIVRFDGKAKTAGLFKL